MSDKKKSSKPKPEIAEHPSTLGTTDGGPGQSEETRTDRWVRRAKDHPFVCVIVVVGIIIVATAQVLGGLTDIVGFFTKLWPTGRDEVASEIHEGEDKSATVGRTTLSKPQQLLSVGDDFRTLMARIEGALHGKRATVTESAALLNHDTGEATKVDILVTFELGGISYRTGIECRHDPMPAGPDWIAELRSKREGCRLDKIIAVHSAGFAEGAANLAEKYGILAITPKSGTDVDWTEQVLPIRKVCLQTVKCRLPNGIVLSLVGNTPRIAEAGSSKIVFPGNGEMTVNDLAEQVRELIRRHYCAEFDATGKPTKAVKELDISKTLEIRLAFPLGTSLIPTKGETVQVESGSGIAEVSVQRKLIDALEYISLGEDVTATHADLTLGGHRASITLTRERGLPGEIGLCFYWEGGGVGKYEEEQIDAKGIRIWIREPQ